MENLNENIKKNKIHQIFNAHIEAAAEVSASLSPETYRDLIGSLPERMKEKLNAKGASTKYSVYSYSSSKFSFQRKFSLSVKYAQIIFIYRIDIL